MEVSHITETYLKHYYKMIEKIGQKYDKNMIKIGKKMTEM